MSATEARLGRIGIFGPQFRWEDPVEALDAVAELEELGFETLWIPGGAGEGDIFADANRLLGATREMAVATAILNIWMHDPHEAAERSAETAARHPGRFLLGVGVSHEWTLATYTDQRYERPYAKVVGYLDALDRADPPVPRARRALAALGPKMLEVARERTAGTLPSVTSPVHTAMAREILGPGPLLAPELKVVLEPDPERARAIARRHLQFFLKFPNYANNLRREGFGDEDLVGGGSDRLVDRLCAHGTPEKVVARVEDHFDAGATHVALIVLKEDRHAFCRDEWRLLGPALADHRARLD